MIPFIRIPNIFSSQLLHTSKEVVVIVSTSDLSFIQNLLEVNKMEMAHELYFNMLKSASSFSLVSAEQGDALASGSPFKKRVT